MDCLWRIVTIVVYSTACCVEGSSRDDSDSRLASTNTESLLQGFIPPLLHRLVFRPPRSRLGPESATANYCWSGQFPSCESLSFLQNFYWGEENNYFTLSWAFLDCWSCHKSSVRLGENE